jgi:hypothetical protein
MRIKSKDIYFTQKEPMKSPNWRSRLRISDSRNEWRIKVQYLENTLLHDILKRNKEIREECSLRIIKTEL